jgi:hypothetical protein
MAPEHCARCGELKELPDDYDVCETCAKKVSTGEISRMLAPEAHKDAQEGMPDFVKERRAEREHKRRKRVENWNKRHQEAQESGEVFEGEQW